MLAVDVLAIQGSSVPCERVFSSGKETMSAHRNRIKYDLMEALQMLKFSINRGKELNFTAGLGRQDELCALENLDHLDSLVPEDLTAFRHNIVLPHDGDDASISSEESDLDDE
jgi:hAT family C-terminal dimerisation region